MARNNNRPDSRVENVETTLGLLSAIDAEQSHTQRGLASRLGVALGLTNALLKRTVRKGLIKIKDAPARRYAYYLTPEGFREKSRLVGEYLNTSLNFFRQSRDQYESVFEYCVKRDWDRVVLIGTGELAEIASLAAHSIGMKLVGIVDEASNVDEFCGLAVFQNLQDAGEVDAVVITDSSTPQQAFGALISQIPSERILAPSILHISHTNRMAAEEEQ